MGADPTPPASDLCDAILHAVAIADRHGDHLTGALLMHAFESAGCAHPVPRETHPTDPN